MRSHANNPCTYLFLLGLLAIAGCDEAPSTAPPSGSSQPSASASAETGTPEIVAAAPVFEFGKVKLGATVEHVFKVKNAGTGPLEITRAKGS